VPEGREQALEELVRLLARLLARLRETLKTEVDLGRDEEDQSLVGRNRRRKQKNRARGTPRPVLSSVI
jgi:hypothetical protein